MSDYTMIFEKTDVETGGVIWKEDSSQILFANLATRSLKIMDIKTHEILLTLPGTWGDWSQNGNFIILIRDQQIAEIYDAKNGTLRGKLDIQGQVQLFLKNKKDNRLLIISDEISIWDIETQQKELNIDNFVETVRPSATWSSDGSQILFVADDTIYLWDVELNRSIEQHRLPENATLLFSQWAFESFGDWNVEQNSMAFYFKQHDCIEACSDSTGVWQLEDNRFLYHADFAITGLEWRPEARQLFGVFDQRTPMIWDVETDTFIYELELPAPKFPLYLFSTFSPNGQYLAAWFIDSVYIWLLPPA